LDPKDEAAFRKAYEELILLPDARQQLVHVARDLKQLAGASLPQEHREGRVSENDDIWLRLQTNHDPPRLFIFDESQEAVCIGKRGYGNDVVPFGNAGLSRVHAIILHVGDSVVVCDVGSLYGFRICERSGAQAIAQQEDESAPGRRKPLIVGLEETAMLQLGPAIAKNHVVINPKKCVVCMDKEREGTFGCGHFACCRTCAARLGHISGGFPLCPLCMAPIVEFYPGLAAVTAPLVARAGQ
jgi:hypothetical protein